MGRGAYGWGVSSTHPHGTEGPLLHFFVTQCWLAPSMVQRIPGAELSSHYLAALLAFVLTRSRVDVLVSKPRATLSLYDASAF